MTVPRVLLATSQRYTKNLYNVIQAIIKNAVFDELYLEINNSTISSSWQSAEYHVHVVLTVFVKHFETLWHESTIYEVIMCMNETHRH